jgi:hypothetical protein
MEIILEEVIENASIKLDGKSFVGCTLQHCVLQYNGGPVSFDRTVFRGCKYVFFGSARSTVHFLQAVGLITGDSSLWGEFPEQVQ